VVVGKAENSRKKKETGGPGNEGKIRIEK